jgi:hypothetical protein
MGLMPVKVTDGTYTILALFVAKAWGRMRLEMWLVAMCSIDREERRIWRSTDHILRFFETVLECYARWVNRAGKAGDKVIFNAVFSFSSVSWKLSDNSRPNLRPARLKQGIMFRP